MNTIQSYIFKQYKEWGYNIDQYDIFCLLDNNESITTKKVLSKQSEHRALTDLEKLCDAFWTKKNNIVTTTQFNSSNITGNSSNEK